jgi:hypothetical protein
MLRHVVKVLNENGKGDGEGGYVHSGNRLGKRRGLDTVEHSLESGLDSGDHLVHCLDYIA